MFHRTSRHAALTQFSESELQALWALRQRYRTEHAPLSSRELAHLRFIRWLSHRRRWNDRAEDHENQLPISHAKGVGALIGAYPVESCPDCRKAYRWLSGR